MQLVLWLAILAYFLLSLSFLLFIRYVREELGVLGARTDNISKSSFDRDLLIRKDVESLETSHQALRFDVSGLMTKKKRNRRESQRHRPMLKKINKQLKGLA